MKDLPSRYIYTLYFVNTNTMTCKKLFFDNIILKKKTYYKLIQLFLESSFFPLYRLTSINIVSLYLLINHIEIIRYNGDLATS